MQMFVCIHDKWSLIYECKCFATFFEFPVVETVCCLRCVRFLCSKKQLYKWCTKV